MHEASPNESLYFLCARFQHSSFSPPCSSLTAPRTPPRPFPRPPMWPIPFPAGGSISAKTCRRFLSMTPRQESLRQLFHLPLVQQRFRGHTCGLHEDCRRIPAASAGGDSMLFHHLCHRLLGIPENAVILHSGRGYGIFHGIRAAPDGRAHLSTAPRKCSTR